jgi:hypothetical protein
MIGAIDSSNRLHNKRNCCYSDQLPLIFGDAVIVWVIEPLPFDDVRVAILYLLTNKNCKKRIP